MYTYQYLLISVVSLNKLQLQSVVSYSVRLTTNPQSHSPHNRSAPCRQYCSPGNQTPRRRPWTLLSCPPRSSYLPIFHRGARLCLASPWTRLLIRCMQYQHGRSAGSLYIISLGRRWMLLCSVVYLYAHGGGIVATRRPQVSCNCPSFFC
jgi:hypothetical protein